MIVSTTDTIPGKKIVKMLGLVEASSGFLALTLAPNPEKDARKKLEKKAEQLGANAILVYRSERAHHRVRAQSYVRSYGTAVVVQDEK